MKYIVKLFENGEFTGYMDENGHQYGKRENARAYDDKEWAEIWAQSTCEEKSEKAYNGVFTYEIEEI